MSAISQIERDLDWRESELAVLKILLSNKDLSEREKLVLFRAAWALLYAHYEGFCKFALTVFYDSIQLKGLDTKTLPQKMQVIALEKAIKKLKNMPSFEFLEGLLKFENENLLAPPEFPEVNTESNLWPSVLRELLDCASLNVPSLNQFENTLKTLVGKRNAIAHGERHMIPDFTFYVSYDSAVRDLMYDLAISIHERLEELQ